MKHSFDIVCTFRPTKKQKVTRHVSLMNVFGQVTMPKIDEALKTQHAGFFNMAHDRYQWEIKNEK